MASSGLAIEITNASGAYSWMPAATCEVMPRLIFSNSSRVGMVPSGRFLRGTPAVLITMSAPLMTL